MLFYVSLKWARSVLAANKLYQMSIFQSSMAQCHMNKIYRACHILVAHLNELQEKCCVLCKEINLKLVCTILNQLTS